MRFRSLAVATILVAIVAALFAAGCSDISGSTPSPTVDNTNVKPPKSVEPTLGIETTITVPQLTARLVQAGVPAKMLAANQHGLFVPAKYFPYEVNGAFTQVYLFKNAKEAKGAAKTVEADGFVLGATPTTSVNVNWTGWPAYFRSGDMIVIFVTEKGPKAHTARDAKAFKALESVFGPPFIGGQTATSSHGTTGTVPATSTVSSTTTGI